MEKLEKTLIEIAESTEADSKTKNFFITAAKNGSFCKDDDPQTHFCVYFAPYDPIKRAVFIGHHKKSGLWLFNGGHIDKNETPKQALKREIGEEWGIDMDVNGLAPSLLTVTNIISNPAKRPCKNHCDIWFFIATDSEKFAPDVNLLSKEFYETGWKSFDEARKLSRDPNTLRGIGEIEKII